MSSSAQQSTDLLTSCETISKAQDKTCPQMNNLELVVCMNCVVYCVCHFCVEKIYTDINKKMISYDKLQCIQSHHKRCFFVSSADTEVGTNPHYSSLPEVTTMSGCSFGSHSVHYNNWKFENRLEVWD